MRSLRLRRLVVVSVAGLLLTLLNVPPALAQPANDDFDSAAVIGALPFTDSISTAEATTADDDPFCNGNEHTVWYSFTPTQNERIQADTSGSDYDTTLSVYTGSRGALSQVGCASFPAQVTLDVSANTTYFFMVASACCGGPGGTLVLNVRGPPANDEISGPTHNTVWFSFTPTVSQPLNLDRSGSNYDGILSVLTDLGSGPVLIACGFRFQAGVRFDATAGRTYCYVDSGPFEGGGQLQLTLVHGIVMTVVADQTGTVSLHVTAVVRGTLACNPAAPPQGGAGSPTLDIVLRQKISKTLVIEGHKDLSIPCPTTPTAWSATIIGDNGPFRTGQAEVFVTGFACDQVACDSPEVRQSIRLNWEK